MSDRSREGFTLIEVLVAIVLLTIGLLPVAGALGAASSGSARAGVRGEVAELTFGKLEDLRSMARSKAVADTMEMTMGGSLLTSLTDHADTVTTSQGIPVVRRWTVVAGPVPRSREVQVRGELLGVHRLAGVVVVYTTLVLM